MRLQQLRNSSAVKRAHGFQLALEVQESGTDQVKQLHFEQTQLKGTSKNVSELYGFVCLT